MPIAVQALRDCLYQCQQVEGLPAQDCQVRCNTLTPGDIAVPTPGGSCTDFWSCYASDISASTGTMVHNAVSSVADLATQIGQGVGGTLGGVIAPLRLPLGLIVVGLIAVAVIISRQK